MGSILSDQLLKDLMAVGQVDVLVAIPTQSSAATITHVVQTLLKGLDASYARERTLLMIADCSSADETLAYVEAATQDSRRSTQQLRTTHRIGASGFAGKSEAMHAVFAAADLLQSRATVVVDPDSLSIDEDWVGRLAHPVLREEIDFVARRYVRSPLEGLLITQLIRPLLSAAFREIVTDPVGGEFACSHAFAAHCLESDLWALEPHRFGSDPWLVTTALADGFAVGEALLGPHTLASGDHHRDLTEVFCELVGASFGCLSRHADSWLRKQSSSSVRVFGDEIAATRRKAAPRTLSMVGRFRSGVLGLEPILQSIMGADTYLAITQLARGTAKDVPIISDQLWARVVFDFASAYHHGLMHREHLVMALFSLYLGRVASFVRVSSGQGEAAVGTAISDLSEAFRRERPYLETMWEHGDSPENDATARNPKPDDGSSRLGDAAAVEDEPAGAGEEADHKDLRGDPETAFLAPKRRRKSRGK